MAEYTYKDIIIDPTSEEAKNAIGKEVYFADTPASCLNAAKNNNKAYLGYLKKLDLGDEEQPFYVNEFVVSAPSSWTCIIVKKEEPKPKYVPFESLEEFLIAYDNQDLNKMGKLEQVVYKHGIYLNRGDGLRTVKSLFNSGFDFDRQNYSWKSAYEIGIKFLDGTPCGKESKDV